MNMALCIQIIRIVDTTPPVISCPPDVTFECDNVGDSGTATATDNCDPDPGISFEDNVLPGACPEEQIIERTWTATDNCGNSASCLQIISIVDTTPPVISCPPDLTFECDAVGDFGIATATDNCDPDPEINFTDDIQDGRCPEEQTIIRTWQATDNCGNSSTCVQTISIVDTTPPIITCPPDATFECDELIEFGQAEASDNCDPDPEITWEDVEIEGDCLTGLVVERTWTATDNCGNSASCVQIITILDTTPPVITCPPDFTVQCLEDVPPCDPNDATAVDNCSTVTIICLPDTDNGGSGCPGDPLIITRTYRALDICDNAAECVQLITVLDDTPPVISCPVDVTFECDDIGDSGAATATDNCDPDVTITFVDVVIPGVCPEEQTIERTWTATDDCDNIDFCVQIITIVDETPPIITCPPDVTFECDDVGDSGQATATDNCDPDVDVSFVDVVIPGVCPEEETIQRTWTATDNCGNTASCLQIITIVDTTPPIITCPPDVTFECDNIGDPGVPVSVDNCDPDVEISFEDNVLPGRCPEEETIERTWTAVDNCGNTASCVQIISIVDTTAPVITCPPDVTFECDAVGDFGTASATDNCDPVVDITFVDVVIPGACPEEETIERTWTAVDNCGNSDSCVQTISIVDTTPPVITCPPDATFECDEMIVLGMAVAVDNCDPEVDITCVEEVIPGVCEQEYTIIRTCTATDNCGNTASCVQTISVVDNTPPVITCPSDATIECDMPYEFTVTASDNCDPEPTITSTFDDGVDPDIFTVEVLGNGIYRITIFATGTVTVTSVAEDDCGNVSTTCVFTVSAVCEEGGACTPGYWRQMQHFASWCTAGYNPVADFCFPGDASKFVDAFELVDVSAAPNEFDPDITLLYAVNNPGGIFNQTLFHGTAALLNAAHPEVDFGHTVGEIKQIMQDAFAGVISFQEAKGYFSTWNEDFDCPLNGTFGAIENSLGGVSNSTN
jgi:microcystin-dependent protein